MKKSLTSFNGAEKIPKKFKDVPSLRIKTDKVLENHDSSATTRAPPRSTSALCGSLSKDKDSQDLT